VAGSKWEKLYEYSEHTNSVNCLSFCPYEYGLILICGSADGSISIHEYKSKYYTYIDDNWNAFRLANAHALGVNCLTWASYNDETNINSNNLSQLKFISGGNDNTIRIWIAKENNFGFDIASFTSDVSFIGHDNSVKDIAWKFNNEQNNEIIISSGEVYFFVTIG
jgi:protein transport protein SEC13